MDNPESLATLGIQDTGLRQNKMSNTDPTNKPQMQFHTLTYTVMNG
jgi:hypothetical protein